MDFWKRNHARSNIYLSRLRRERKDFEKILAESDFGDEGVVSVEIDNPDDVSFVFCDM